MNFFYTIKSRLETKIFATKRIFLNTLVIKDAIIAEVSHKKMNYDSNLDNMILPILFSFFSIYPNLPVPNKEVAPLWVIFSL